LGDRRNVGENSCKSGDGTDQTGPILDVYDDDDDDDKAKVAVCPEIRTKHSTQSEHHVEFLNVKPGGR